MKRAFTIIELLIAVFIFSVVMLVASTSLASGFLTGRNESTGSEEVNRSLSVVMDLIGQKMAIANDTVNISGGGKIYGFKYSVPNLTTVSMGVGSSGAAKQCTSFVLQNKAILMKQIDCNGSFTFPTIYTDWESITPAGLEITAFNVTSSEYSTTTRNAPYVQIKITGVDKGLGTGETGKTMTLQNSFSIPKYTYNKW